MNGLVDAHRAIERAGMAIRSVPLGWSIPMGCVIASLSAPIGLYWAKDLDLDFALYAAVFLFAAAVFGGLGAWIGGAFDRLRRLAMTDPLTGLYNRRQFGLRLHAEVGGRRPLRRTTCVLCLDVDRLKAINDSSGHRAGDRALLAVCKVLRSSVRATDTVARLGGDEFAILLPNASAARALVISRGILERVRAAASSTRPLTVSIGIAEVGVGAALPWVELLAAADAALYRAKVAGGGGAALARLGPARGAARSRASHETTLFVEDLVGFAVSP